MPAKCAGGPGRRQAGAGPLDAGEARLTQEKHRNAHDFPGKAAERLCCCCGRVATCWTETDAPTCERCYHEVRGDLAGRLALAAIARRKR